MNEFEYTIIRGEHRVKEQKVINDIVLSAIVRESKLHNTYLEISHCEFEGVQIDSIPDEIISSIIFKNCIFNDHFEIINGNLSYRFENCNFNSNKIEIHNSANAPKFELKEVKNVHLHFNNNRNLKSINILNSNIENLSIVNSGIEDLLVAGKENRINFFEIVNTKSLNWFNLIEGNYEYIELSNSDFNKLKIQGDSSNKIEFNIQTLLINSLTTNELLVSNVRITDFQFYRSICKEDKSLINCLFNGSVDFFGQNLNHFVFSGVDFQESELSFDNSQILATEFYNILWPNKYLLHPDYNKLKSTDKDKRNLRSLSEQYRQLKVKAQQGGDKIASLSFYSHEMEINHTLAKQADSEQLWDWLLLFTNKHFSNFGLSYVRPFIFLFCIHTILFTLFILVGYNNLEFVWPWYNSLAGLGDSFGHFFYLLNPLHKLPEVENSWILVIDFFSRILNSYFIYYFLKATRKFTFN